jgi:mycothiol synthase
LDWVALSPDGTFAAFCTCQINNDRNALTGKSEGWVAILGTRRGFRRQGLGRAMLLWGLQLLQAENIETALLGVDSENPNHAQSLYESVGFKQVRTQVLYKKRL